MQENEVKNIYFLSDFHLGAPDKATSLEREKLIVQFLQSITPTASEIFILGDIFDFWFEYKKVVPKGYVRLLGALASITDAGIPVHFFVGNHDMWMKDYFQQELNIPVYFSEQQFERNGKSFLLAHGDGLGPGDHNYKRLKKIFRNPLCYWAFGILPPKWGIGIADYFSKNSRKLTGVSDSVFLGEENEWLIIHSKEYLKHTAINYFIYGHRHLPMDIMINAQSRYVNLGDWIHHFTYAVFDGNDLQLKSYKDFEDKIVRIK